MRAGANAVDVVVASEASTNAATREVKLARLACTIFQSWYASHHKIEHKSFVKSLLLIAF